MSDHTLLCPKCGTQALCVDSSVIYGRSYGLTWQCPNCPDHYVGCHGKTDKPLGTLCGPEVRELRKRCHAAFDQLWKSNGMTRGAAYRWMQKTMKIPRKQAHIAMFDEWQCRALLAELSVRKGIQG